MADVLISQLPKTTEAGDSDLLIIDSFDSATGGIVTNAIKWSDLYTKISSFPQGIKFPDGTALQPSITFVNDTNTGIYRQADDTIGFTTNGIARMVINGAGNIGVNTLTPDEKFQIKDGNLSLQFGASNEFQITAADGGISLRQKEFLPLTLATNDVTRMTVTGFGSVLIDTDDEVSGVSLNVGGVIQADGATINGIGGGVTAIGHNTGTKKDLLHLNFNGAIGNIDQNYGTNGQVLMSRGPGQSFTWGEGGGPGGGGLDFKGSIDVTQTAPAAIDGDFYLNDTAGLVHPSFNVGNYNAEVNAFVIFDGTDWTIQNQAPTGTYVDLVSDQTVGGSKTFTEEILGTAQNCSRTITAGEGLKGGGQLLSDITLTVDTGNGLGIESDNLVALAGDDTIIVDAAGIKVNVSELFEGSDPDNAFAVTSFNGRKGDVVPQEADYDLTDLGDVDTASAQEGYILTAVGSQFEFRPLEIEGTLQFQGSIDATVVTAPVDAEVGYFWVQTVDGTVLDDASWGSIRNTPVLAGAMIAKAPQPDGETVPQWDLIGSTGGGAGVETITAQNGVTNQGTAEDPVLEVDSTVVRTTGIQTIDGTKTFQQTIIGDLQGDVEGEATDCSRSVLAGNALTGGGKLDADVTLHVNHDTAMEIVADELTPIAGNGLKKGSDGNGGPLTIDTDWLDDNYSPDVSGEIGDGSIDLVAATNGGLVVTGQNATANQAVATQWSIGVDATIVKTTGDQSIDGNKTFVQNIITDGVTSTNFTTSADFTATGKITCANFDIGALPDLSTAP